MLRMFGFAPNLVRPFRAFLLGRSQRSLNRDLDLGRLCRQCRCPSTRPARPFRARLQRLLHRSEQQHAHELPEDNEGRELNDEGYVGR